MFLSDTGGHRSSLSEIEELASVYYQAIPWRMEGTAADVESSLESEVHRG